ncbi:right-handed parallel beta-helix repeat-containing protein [Sporomusa acidovorans]|uniref:Periplasmic copper-binding protein NosD beta helix domain-containing protein n=1 Tax=Sporomusa acidovorans (strain ATCC 49682 / DSM 3132 / Mol) TaxID=1123286 RepID=A0ABZ3IZ71_SPOA4|nr:right-handed parallel beta-helix repeat-containing protein [Sporomusa acidovorans]OZC17245.1 pectate lyase superfamily protein [Sporomusa acidovorans DSM 3132]SDF15606.1 parallel beta-helix repeat (two copies) [Sporomusa acidovorans]
MAIELPGVEPEAIEEPIEPRAINYGFIDVKNFGVIGDGITDDTAAFKEIIKTYATNAVTLIVSSNVVISSDATIPTNIGIQMVDNGCFTVSNGVLTINGPFSAPDAQQIFSSNSKVVGLKYATPLWWGAKGDGITDDTTAFKRAVYSVTLRSEYYLSDDSLNPWNYVRANNIKYVLNQVVRWCITENDDYLSIWRCTSAGTSGATAPDITGKKVLDTVTDGTVVWTKLSDGYISPGKVYVPASFNPYMVNGYSDNHNRGIIIYSPMTFEMHPNAVIKQVPLSSEKVHSILNIRQAKNVTINGGKILGERVDHSFTGNEITVFMGIGVEIFSSYNVTIRDIHLGDFIGDGSCCFCETNMNINCKNIVYDNVVFENNTMDGLTINSVYNIKVINCTFYHTNGANPNCGIDIESSTSDTGSIFISNCLFENNVEYGIIGGSGRGFCNVIISNNIFKNNGVGLQLNGTFKNVNVLGNIYYGGTGGVVCGSGTNITISGNKFISSKNGIYTTSSFTTGTITNNTLTTLEAALVGSPTNSLIADNYFCECGSANGEAAIKQSPENCSYLNNVFVCSVSTRPAMALNTTPTIPSILNGNIARYGTYANMFNVNTAHILGKNYTL